MGLEVSSTPFVCCGAPSASKTFGRLGILVGVAASDEQVQRIPALLPACEGLEGGGLASEDGHDGAVLRIGGPDQRRIWKLGGSDLSSSGMLPRAQRLDHGRSELRLGDTELL